MGFNYVNSSPYACLVFCFSHNAHRSCNM